MKIFFDILKEHKTSIPQRYQLKGKKLIRRHELGQCWIEFEFTDDWDEETESILKCIDVFWCFDINEITKAFQSGAPNMENSYSITFDKFLDTNKLENEAQISKLIKDLFQKLEDFACEESKLFNPSYYYHNYFNKDDDNLFSLRDNLILSFYMREVKQEDFEILLQDLRTEIETDGVGPSLRKNIINVIDYLQNIPREFLSK